MDKEQKKAKRLFRVLLFFYFYVVFTAVLISQDVMQDEVYFYTEVIIFLLHLVFCFFASLLCNTLYAKTLSFSLPKELLQKVQKDCKGHENTMLGCFFQAFIVVYLIAVYGGRFIDKLLLLPF